MSEWLEVHPGVNLSQWFRDNGGITKKTIREVMRQHPEWDWRILTPGVSGTYINGEDAIKGDVTLMVEDPDDEYAFVATVARIGFGIVDGETVAVVY